MKRDRTQPCDQIGQLERRASENEGGSIKDVNKHIVLPLPRGKPQDRGDNPRHLHRPNALPIVGAYGLGSGIVG